MELGATDRTAATFSFFTADKGEVAIRAKVKLRFSPNVKLEGELPMFTIEAPRLTSVRPTVEKWQQTKGAIAWNQAQMGVGGLGASGTRWRRVKIIVPSPFPTGGEGGFFQFITARRSLSREGNEARNDHYGVRALDHGMPYGVTETKGGWTLPGIGDGQDNPAQYFAAP